MKIKLDLSQNFSPKIRLKKNIKFIIIHYTGMQNELSALNKLCDINAKVSAHYFIKKNGSVLNLVPPLYEAWHAGKSSWKGLKSLNRYSIGIEIQNSGHDHKYEDFSKKQITSTKKLLKYLIYKYKVNLENILGHSDIAPDRKKDPGEKFPWKELAKSKLSQWHNLDENHLIHVLAEATHPPLALTFLGYKKEQISHPLDGFGFLVPEVEKRKILGTLFSSTLFSNRAPKQKALLTSFVGGERNPELCGLPDDDLISLADTENRELLGIQGKPEFSHLVRWPKSIPLPDHLTTKRLEAATLLKQKNIGLSFSGSHISGAPLPNCLSVT